MEFKNNGTYYMCNEDWFLNDESLFSFGMYFGKATIWENTHYQQPPRTLVKVYL